MPRISRREILGDGEYYHITARGIAKRPLFRAKRDYKFFVEVTRHYLQQFQIHIYHYCLMKNHIHFLLQATIGWELPKFMQRILQKYALYFRYRYDSPGHLFENRYKCYLLDRDSYILDCARYIERNPLMAGIVGEVSKYKWNSFNFYANGATDPLIMTSNPLYLEFGTTQLQRQKNYNEYILEMRPSDLIKK